MIVLVKKDSDSSVERAMTSPRATLQISWTIIQAVSLWLFISFYFLQLVLAEWVMMFIMLPPDTTCMGKKGRNKCTEHGWRFKHVIKEQP